MVSVAVERLPTPTIITHLHDIGLAYSFIGGRPSSNCSACQHDRGSDVATSIEMTLSWVPRNVFDSGVPLDLIQLPVR